MGTSIPPWGVFQEASETANWISAHMTDVSEAVQKLAGPGFCVKVSGTGINLKRFTPGE